MMEHKYRACLKANTQGQHPIIFRPATMRSLMGEEEELPLTMWHGSSLRVRPFAATTCGLQHCAAEV